MQGSDLVLRRRALLGAALLALPLLVPGAAARTSSDLEQARASVQRLADALIRLLSTDDLAEAEDSRRLGEVVDEEADLELLGRLVLARHWRSASEAQQERYLELFRGLMLQRFAGHLRAYAGSDLGPPEELFEITGIRELNGRDIVVRSRVDPPSRQPLTVDWRLRRRDGKPRIIDVIVEGASLLITQRSEFASVIDRAGIDGLLEEMQRRVEGTV